MKTILITGVANGLGKELLAGAAAAGHEVIGLDCVELPESRGTVRYIRCDLRSRSERQHAIEQVFANHTRLDVLVNNAAIGTVTPLEYVDASWIEDCITVNLTAPLALIREVLPDMRRNGAGRIINISSLSSIASVPGTAVYAASKAGLERGSKILRAELRGTGISVGLVRLGRMRTDSYFRVGRMLRQQLGDGQYSGYKSIEDALWAVVNKTNVGLEPNEAARRVLEFAWTSRPRITIAPFGERVQASLANRLPPLVLNGLMGLAGRMERPT